MPIALRTDYDGCESKDANLTRRIIRDWVLRFQYARTTWLAPPGACLRSQHLCIRSILIMHSGE